MIWHTYEISPIDSGWSRLKTVSETAKELAIEHAERVVGAVATGHDSPNLNEFVAGWKEAQEAAGEAGWEGDFRQPPVVFWIPGDTAFSFGFVIKQDNNGTTYIVSPEILPHLEDLAS